MLLQSKRQQELRKKVITMSGNNQLIKIARYNTKLNAILNVNFDAFMIYRSKGLLTHLINRKHFIAVKYIDYLQDIIQNPDYAGYNNGKLELIKCYNDNIFISIKLDSQKECYYVATVYEVKKSKIDAYVKCGRLSSVNIN